MANVFFLFYQEDVLADIKRAKLFLGNTISVIDSKVEAEIFRQARCDRF